jgi:hypothetical protein
MRREVILSLLTLAVLDTKYFCSPAQYRCISGVRVATRNGRRRASPLLLTGVINGAACACQLYEGAGWARGGEWACCCDMEGDLGVIGGSGGVCLEEHSLAGYVRFYMPGVFDIHLNPRMQHLRWVRKESQASIKQRSRRTWYVWPLHERPGKINFLDAAHRTCANTTPAPHTATPTNDRLLSSHKLQHSPTSGVPAQQP